MTPVLTLFQADLSWPRQFHFSRMCEIDAGGGYNVWWGYLLSFLSYRKIWTGRPKQQLHIPTGLRVSINSVPRHLHWHAIDDIDNDDAHTNLVTETVTDSDMRTHTDTDTDIDLDTDTETDMERLTRIQGAYKVVALLSISTSKWRWHINFPH